MPWNLLLLPLLGGFVFATLFPLTKYSAQRSDGHRLLFFAALSGVGLLIITVVVKAIIRYYHPGFYADVAGVWNFIIPIPYSATATFAFLLAFPLGFLGRLIPRNFAVDFAIKRKADPFEMLLLRATTESRMVAITVGTGKFYIGYVTTKPNPGQSILSIGIFPQMSGYRDPDDKTFRFTTDYITAQESIRARLQEEYHDFLAGNPDIQPHELRHLYKQLSREMELRDFEIIIPISEIRSINIFDPDVYNDHFDGRLSDEDDDQETPADDDPPTL